MRKIETSTRIDATPTEVWQVLARTADYPLWNPFIRRLDGELAVGERLTLSIRAGIKEMTFRPVVLAAEPGVVLRWRGKLGVRGVFDGVHEIRLEELEDGSTLLRHSEIFTGALVPLLAGTLRDTEAGFVAMNEALRARVAEQRLAGTFASDAAAG